jgi:hypothetical protein|tara:strand:+ start:3795 stop:4157 length:363 start_codon:yes stop_codon:yes gene_type:complete
MLRSKKVTLETDASGDAVKTFGLAGRIVAIRYEKDDYADTVDFDIQSGWGDELWDEDNITASTIQYPRVPVQDGPGADVTFDGTEEIYEAPVTMGGVVVTIASGGDTKSGSFIFVYEPIT